MTLKPQSIGSLRTSVVIPTYYRSNDLDRLLESLLKQTVKPLEIIVVDDTPTDVIETLCIEYQGKLEASACRLIYLKNPKERSASTARNLGAKVAEGDIIMFLDSDVVLYQDHIEKVIDVFKRCKNALGVQGWNVNAKDKARIHPFIKAIQAFFKLEHFVQDSCRFAEYPYLLTKTINCECLAGADLAVKSGLLKEFRFDEALKKYSYMEDLLFSCSIHQKYPNSLFITPNAKYIHKFSNEARMVDRGHLRQCSKYVLTRLFGVKGWFIYYWQTLGTAVIDWLGKILSLYEALKVRISRSMV